MIVYQDLALLNTFPREGVCTKYVRDLQLERTEMARRKAERDRQRRKRMRESSREANAAMKREVHDLRRLVANILRTKRAYSYKSQGYLKGLLR